MAIKVVGSRGALVWCISFVKTCMYVVDKFFVVVWTLVQGLFLFGFISVKCTEYFIIDYIDFLCYSNM